MNDLFSVVSEPERTLPLVAECDVLVCGGGPAGVAAALAAARTGARVVLLENQGCLGGVWTAGALSWIIDHENKNGLMREILERLEARGHRAIRDDGTPTSGYDVEGMKLQLETMCVEAGVRVRLHTRVVGALREEESPDRIAFALTESKSGREAWRAKVFVDCTGDGDFAALAGCGFDIGHPQSGETQPMTLMALLTGIPVDEAREYINGEGLPWGGPHGKVRGAMEQGGASPSYSYPALFRLHDDLFALMANHQYGVSALDADAVTRATLEARAEIHRLVEALRRSGSPLKNVRLVATGAHIGVREARRIHGLYTVTADDLQNGVQHDDAVCHATFGVDIHSTNPSKSKGLGNGGVKAQPYDIPLRALIARDVDGLLLAGRCISGDFWAHGSYRVTGNAVAMGESAGIFAARCARERSTPHQLAPQGVSLLETSS